MEELLKLGLMTVFVFAVQQGCICLWSKLFRKKKNQKGKENDRKRN